MECCSSATLLRQSRKTLPFASGMLSERRTVACLCSCEALDACIQVEDPAGGADRQDSSGTLRWEAHIDVLSMAAAPPQPTAAAVPVQRHRREGADRESAAPAPPAHCSGAAEAEAGLANSVPRSSQETLEAARVSAQSAAKVTLARQPGRASAENDAAPLLQHIEGQAPSAVAQAKPQVAPWTDADGVLNGPYWRSLTQHAMSAVLRSPGMPLLPQILIHVRAAERRH